VNYLTKITLLSVALSVLVGGVFTNAMAADKREITASDLTALAWRPIGPANMGGRVAAIAFVRTAMGVLMR
jgi:hypothetical protein